MNLVVNANNFEAVMTCVGAVRRAKLGDQYIYMANDVLADLERNGDFDYIEDCVDVSNRGMVYNEELGYVTIVTEDGLSQLVFGRQAF